METASRKHLWEKQDWSSYGVNNKPNSMPATKAVLSGMKA